MTVPLDLSAGIQRDTRERARLRRCEAGAIGASGGRRRGGSYGKPFVMEGAETWLGSCPVGSAPRNHTLLMR